MKPVIFRAKEVIYYLGYILTLKIKDEIYFLNKFNVKNDLITKYQHVWGDDLQQAHIFPSIREIKKFFNSSSEDEDDIGSHLETFEFLYQCFTDNVIKSNVEYKNEKMSLHVINLTIKSSDFNKPSLHSYIEK